MATVQATDPSPVVGAIQYAKEVAKNLHKNFNWLGRRVTLFSKKKMSPSLAKLVQAAYRSLPYVAMRLIVPFPWFLFPAAAVIVYKSLHASPSFEDLQNGTAIGCAGLGTVQCIGGIVRVNPFRLISGITNLAAAAMLFTNTLSPSHPRSKARKEAAS